MSNYVEPYATTTENIGKNYVLNRISRDGSNADTGQFFIQFLAEDNLNPGILSICSNSSLVAFAAADGGSRASADTPTLTFNYTGVVDNLFLCLYAIDPLITAGDDVFALCIKAVDASNFVNGAQITVENLSFDLNEGIPQLAYSIPE